MKTILPPSGDNTMISSVQIEICPMQIRVQRVSRHTFKTPWGRGTGGLLKSVRVGDIFCRPAHFSCIFLHSILPPSVF